MAITQADFNKIWASTSPLTPYEFSENNYKEGWNFVGATPPSRQMWDYLQKLTDEKIKYIYNNMIPCGIVQAFAGSTTPDGWLFCDGSAVSRITYANLYSVIGDTYGAGDGTSTFNLPNLTDKFIEGSSTSGTEHTAGLPEISGTVTNIGSVSGHNYPISMSEAGALGAFGTWGGTERVSYWDSPYVSESNPDAKAGLDFYASRSNPIYGNSTTVQPPALTMRYIIKY